MEIRIIILQRGWVMIGEYERDGFYGRLRRGAVIRNWGTAGDHRGLGYLAAHGPTAETHLEPCALPVEFHELTTVAQLVCDAEIWAPIIAGGIDA